jgi:hypothetical protein
MPTTIGWHWVAVSKAADADDEVRHVTAPFDGIDVAEDFALHSITLRWPDYWRLGGSPY